MRKHFFPWSWFVFAEILRLHFAWNSKFFPGRVCFRVFYGTLKKTAWLSPCTGSGRYWPGPSPPRWCTGCGTASSSRGGRSCSASSSPCYGWMRCPPPPGSWMLASVFAGLVPLGIRQKNAQTARRPGCRATTCMCGEGGCVCAGIWRCTFLWRAPERNTFSGWGKTSRGEVLSFFSLEGPLLVSF